MPRLDFPEGRLVEFRTSDGLVLSGFLAMPKRAKIGVIHVHGMFSSFYRSTLVKTFVREFPRAGVAFLSIETRGSYTLAGFRKGNGRAQVGGGMERFEDCVKDIDAAVRFMKRIGIKHVYLDGISTGSQKIAYYGYTKRGAVKGLVLIGAVDDYNLRRKELGRRFNSAVRLAKSISRRDGKGMLPSEYLGVSLSARRFLSIADPKNPEARLFNYDRPVLTEVRSIKVPILSVFGSREQYATKHVRVLNSILAMNCSSPLSRQIIISGGDHGLRGHEKEACLSIRRWISSIEGASG